MVYRLFEYDNGREFGPASDEDQAAYTAALQSGQSFITKGYHGISLKMTVRKVRTIEEEKNLYGVNG